jgi:hypothetical protein
LAEIKDRFIRGKQPERDLPIVREMIDRPGIETIEQVVDSRLQNDVNLSRQVKMFLCHRYSGKKLNEIGARFGVTESAVTQASRRMRDKRHKDKELEKLILKIVKELSLSIGRSDLDGFSVTSLLF